MLLLTRAAGRSKLVFLVLCITLSACASGSDTTKQASPSPTAEPSPPTETEMAAAFLTAAEVGDGYTGEPPAAENEKIAKSKKPVCGIEQPDELRNLNALFVDSTGTKQVFEDVDAWSPGDAGMEVDARRRQGEARCEYDESVGKTKYHVKVDGPIADFPSFGEASAGYALSYTGGYVGRRYSMVAKIGSATVYMEVTAKDFDPAFAIATFREAVDKATRVFG